jgi:uncharacterized protein YdeI (YjbR/CyaY-like superfamily)
MAILKTDNKLETFDFQDRKAWREWLDKNHDSSPSIWLIVYKKNSGKIGVSLEDVVEEALCFGWIDSKLNVVDEKRFKLLLTPRKPKSIWSKQNKQRAEKLILQGLMTAAGLKKIEAAKKDGSWNRLDAIEEFRLPEDFRKALAADKNALKNFETFSNSLKKQTLGWIENAKKPETRLRRIQQTVTMAAQNRKEVHSSSYLDFMKTCQL